MSCGGPLSAVTMIAGAGVLQNVGLGVAPALGGALGGFNSLPITGQFSDIVSSATGVLSGGNLEALRTLGADSFPALTNAIPGDFTSALSGIAPGGVFDGGFTGLISGTASGLMGQGDLSQFGQIFNSAQGFADQANQFINSNLNIGSLAQTFGPLTGGMDNLITGSFSQVNQAFGAFGGDLSNLGNLIDMNNLGELGNPTALVKQLANVGGIIPGVENVLKQAGISSNDLVSLASGSLPGLTESANKLLYEGMTKITGTELSQVKSILGVTTGGINNMAELLNPAKILPTSFASLTMPTPDGLKGIYATAQGTVNSNLEKYLSGPGVPALIPTDLINNARSSLTQVAGIKNETLTGVKKVGRIV